MASTAGAIASKAPEAGATRARDYLARLALVVDSGMGLRAEDERALREAAASGAIDLPGSDGPTPLDDEAAAEARRLADGSAAITGSTEGAADA